MKTLNIGIVGLDTSHAPAFAKLLNDAANEFHVPGGKVVKAFAGGSKAFSMSMSRVGQFTDEFRAMGIEVVDSIEALAGLDAYFLESVDGNQHLEQFKILVEFGKPIFIDKPLACYYHDAKAIVELAKAKNVPIMTASAIRYAKGIDGALPAGAEVAAVDAFGPMVFFEDYRDYFWYGIHSAELLYSFMGRGCQKVQTFSTDKVDAVVGLWADGRIGKLSGNRINANNFGCTLTTTQGHIAAMVSTEVPFYAMLLRKVVPFFQTGIPAVPVEESLEIIAFLEAVSRSRAEGGKMIEIASL
ncbi:MAG: Gfo/Idh/MocA family protein [Victivallaceae bacterium]